jgi:hypothetical protein
MAEAVAQPFSRCCCLGRVRSERAADFVDDAIKLFAIALSECRESAVLPMITICGMALTAYALAQSSRSLANIKVQFATLSLP